MAQQGAALQGYNNELVKSIEELLQRRAALNKQIEAETNEKIKLETERKKLDERLTTVDASLQAKLNTKSEYDKVIADAEKAYVKILESSQLLLNVVKVKTNDLASGKVRQQEPVKDDKKLVNVSSATSIENLYTQLP